MPGGAADLLGAGFSESFPAYAESPAIAEAIERLLGRRASDLRESALARAREIPTTEAHFRALFELYADRPGRAIARVARKLQNKTSVRRIHGRVALSRKEEQETKLLELLNLLAEFRRDFASSRPAIPETSQEACLFAPFALNRWGPGATDGSIQRGISR
jgi:hypothetical protein